jgi:hypothetical protein
VGTSRVVSTRVRLRLCTPTRDDPEFIVSEDPTTLTFVPASALGPGLKGMYILARTRRSQAISRQSPFSRAIPSLWLRPLTGIGLLKSQNEKSGRLRPEMGGRNDSVSCRPASNSAQQRRAAVP